MKKNVLSLLFCSVVVAVASAAFAPQQHAIRSSNTNTLRADTTRLHEFCRGYVGGESVEPIFIGETSGKNFDPLNFSKRAPEWVPWFRESELKHGRAAMLAVLGMVVPEFVRVPGDAYSFASIPRVLDAHDALPQSMIQIFAWISFLEACSWGALANMEEFDRAPGEFGFDPLGLYPKDPAKQKEMQLKELKNGRLAMVAIGGMVAGASITGKPFPYI